jgi:hypothetical protein
MAGILKIDAKADEYDLSPGKFIGSLLTYIRVWTGKTDSFDDDLTMAVIGIKQGTAQT